jgi:hypothetical protein
VLLAAMATTQAVRPAAPAQAQAAPTTVRFSIDPGTVTQLNAAGVTITGSRGASVQPDDIGGLQVSLPVRPNTAVYGHVEYGYGLTNPGDRNITTNLVGRLTITRPATSTYAVLRDFQGVMTYGTFQVGYLKARQVRETGRFEIAMNTNLPGYEGAVFATQSLANLVSLIAETPLLTDVVEGRPDFHFFGSNPDFEALVPVLPPGAPDPWGP